MFKMKMSMLNEQQPVVKEETQENVKIEENKEKKRMKMKILKVYLTFQMITKIMIRFRILKQIVKLDQVHLEKFTQSRIKRPILDKL